MASETDSVCSIPPSYEEKKKYRKLHKKLKRKSKSKDEKKKSSHKKKKCTEKDTTNVFNDHLQAHRTKILCKLTKNDICEESDAFGPALPPHLLNKNKETERNQSVFMGPVMTKELLENQESSKQRSLCDEENLSAKAEQIEDDNLEGSYGPFPVINELEMTPGQIELEQRALELKMAAIDGVTAQTTSQNVREEWMLKLPEVGLKTGLAALNNLKRGFHQGKEKPDFSDRSSWTNTPNSDQEKRKLESSKDLKLQAQTLYEKQRDAEQEKIAEKHKKKRKREESLVESHQKSLRKEEKKKAKLLKESGLKPERRPFTRDVDLKLDKIDRNQTKQIVDKAKILNSKFASGHSKYL